VPPRLRTDFWVAALRRRAEAAGAYVAIVRRGAAEAGAIFLGVDRGGYVDLYGPAPQSVVADSESGDRLFSLVAQGLEGQAFDRRIEQEVRFDPDLWLVEIEDREGRPFVEVVAEVEKRSDFRIR
jgi:hypothetical protein